MQFLSSRIFIVFTTVYSFNISAQDKMLNVSLGKGYSMDAAIPDGSWMNKVSTTTNLKVGTDKMFFNYVAKLNVNKSSFEYNIGSKNVANRNEQTIIWSILGVRSNIIRTKKATFYLDISLNIYDINFDIISNDANILPANIVVDRFTKLGYETGAKIFKRNFSIEPFFAISSRNTGKTFYNYLVNNMLGIRLGYSIGNWPPKHIEF